MVRLGSSWFRSLTCMTVAASLLLVAGTSDAQKKKKRRKKPAVTAPVKSAPDTPATQSAPSAPKTAAPPAAESESESEEKPSEPSNTAAASGTASASTEGAAAGPSPFPLLEVSLGVRGFQRHLSYTDDIFGQLPSYDLNGAPAGRLGVAVYPLRTPTLSVGLVGSFEYAFALGSTFKRPPEGAAEGTKYSTSAMQYAVGALANLLVGGATLFGGVDYVGQSFTVGLPPSMNSNASVPDVRYTVVRPNVGARIGIAEKFAVVANVGYLLVLEAGEITSNAYFPKARASVGGVDISAGVSYALTPNLELRPAIDYRRYFFKFKPVMGDPFIAGGALDQYLGVSVSAAYLF